jgi:hypothetical protein
LAERGLAVVFAGPSLKADDVIARDVSFVQKALNRDVMVSLDSDGPKEGMDVELGR